MKTWKQEALLPYEQPPNTDQIIANQLERAKNARQIAALEYEEAIIAAVEMEWPNVRIAKAVGVSEAAIRQYRRRKGIS